MCNHTCENGKHFVTQTLAWYILVYGGVKSDNMNKRNLPRFLLHHNNKADFFFEAESHEFMS